MDFPRYAEWNPFIRSISGEVREGARLDVTVIPVHHRERRYEPVMLRVVPEKELRWKGHLWHSSLIMVEHSFRLEPDGPGTRFRQDSNFNGHLVRFIGEETRSTLRGGLEEMNAALKRRAEG